MRIWRLFWISRRRCLRRRSLVVSRFNETNKGTPPRFEDRICNRRHECLCGGLFQPTKNFEISQSILVTSIEIRATPLITNFQPSFKMITGLQLAYLFFCSFFLSSSAFPPYLESRALQPAVPQTDITFNASFLSTFPTSSNPSSFGPFQPASDGLL